MEAFFESTMVLTYAIPKEQLQKLIPPCLELDIYNDKWAFVAVAMVQTKALRPKGFPKFLSNSFFLIGYRVFVRYCNEAGRSLRGLYILGSETNKKSMELLGNVFTHYKYRQTDITLLESGHLSEVSSRQSGIAVRLEDGADDDIPLPAGSPFTDWKVARRFAGPLPFTFSFNPSGKEVLIIEGVREYWKPRPLRVLEHHFSFLDRLHFNDIRLASAFAIKEVPYYWKKGKTEKWKN